MIQDSLVRDFAITLPQLDRVHNLKTASLFKWCLRSPFIALERNDRELHAILSEMGTLLGVLFQRSDDLLDFDVRNREGKAVLGDLKSGYLNSFGVFLLQEASSERREAFLRAQSLGEVISVLGQKNFDERLKEFDRINGSLIDLYDHQLERLDGFLAASEMPLLAELRPLPRPLYWREK